MKLLVVSQYFFPENFRINELVCSLKVRDVEVEVLTGKPNYPKGSIFSGYRAWGCAQEIYQGVLIHRLPVMPRGKGAIRLAINYLSFVVSGIALGGWVLRGRKFDAVFVYAPSPILQAIPAIWLGRIKKCPVVLWVQDLWPESLSATGYITNPSLLRAVKYIVSLIYRNTDLLLIPAKSFFARVQALAGKTSIVYYPNSFIESTTKVQLGHSVLSDFDIEFPVLFAGNIGAAQAMETVLDAATMLRHVNGIRFVMIGDGSRRDWMMRQSAERGLNNLVFHGLFPVDAMPALMEKAAALLVTLTDTEVFRLTIPSKVQAYLAAGRPIIACLNGAGADLVEEAGAGVSVPAEDAYALSEAIKVLHAMPAHERREMGARGRKYYEANFSHEKLVEELMCRLDEVIHHQIGHTS